MRITGTVGKLINNFAPTWILEKTMVLGYRGDNEKMETTLSIVGLRVILQIKLASPKSWRF